MQGYTTELFLISKYKIQLVPLK